MNTLACLIHAGMKRLMPDEDSGLGIEAEYQEAVRLHAGRAHDPLQRRTRRATEWISKNHVSG
jgi:hypothetical protein